MPAMEKPISKPKVADFEEESGRDEEMASEDESRDVNGTYGSDSD